MSKIEIKACPEIKKLIKEFGAKPLDSIKNLPKYRTFERGLFKSHRDFDKFMKAIEKKEKVAIVTGFNASGSIHIGHTTVFETVHFFQKKYNIPVFVPISDDESYVAGKVKDQKEGLENALRIAKELMAFGFDPRKTFFVIDQIYTDIYNFAIKLSRGYTLSTIKATYGYKNEDNPGLFFYPSIQAAHVLMPQLKEFRKIKHVLVPIGPDEDSHIRLARDVAQKFGYQKPSVIHANFMPALDGEKMSTTRPNTAIFLSDDAKIIKKKVGRALTGGRDTAEIQKKQGGNPDNCMIYKYYQAFLIDDERELERIYDECKSGKLLCGEDKKHCCELLGKKLEEYKNNLKKAEKDFKKSILRNPERIYD